MTTTAPNGAKTPLVVPGPWTHEGRTLAIQKESRQSFEGYFTKAMKVRNWVPNELPLAEMRRLGHMLSPDTVTMIQAYLGVEEYIGDYVRRGSSSSTTTGSAATSSSPGGWRSSSTAGRGSWCCSTRAAGPRPS
jgi:hypothetical protein